MKKISVSLCFLLLLSGLAHAAFGIFQTYAPAASPIVNMGGGPNLIERSLFSTNTPTLPYSQWYTPGNGSPAISTSDYFLTSGIYWGRPFDLDTMGPEGAAIKAREGARYIWLLWADHIGSFFGSGSLYAGYSNDPQVYPSPTSMYMIRSENDAVNLVDKNGTTQNNFLVYQIPHLVYNPDPGAFAPFYIYAEGLSTSAGLQHQLSLITTTDFRSSTMQGPAIPTTVANLAFTSFGRPERLGVNNWEVYSFGKPNNAPVSGVFYKYTSTDGWSWTPDYTNIVAGSGPYVTISGQKYLLTVENAASNSYISLLAVNSLNVSLGTYIRISTAFGNNSSLGVTVYPGPTYLQDVISYEEDGVASIYATRGYPPSLHDVTNDGPFLNNSPSFYDIQGSITSNVLTVTSWPAGNPPLAAPFRILFTTTNKSQIIAQLTGTGGAACPDPTCTGGIGTYSVTATANVAAGTQTISTNGGLWQQFVDLYYLITDATAAASAAPLGVRASCSAGVATAQWNNSLPHQNYRIYYGSSADSQPTLVGDVTGTTVSFTPPANQQTWIKVVTMNGGEQKNRVVNVYCSAQNTQVNAHVNRVINDGGSNYDITFIASADSWLTSNNSYRYLQLWTDVRFGYKLDGSGFISKIYDLGTTYLPRGGDYTPTTSNTFPSTSSNTSYSATSFRGTTPSWVNNASTSHGYFGNGRPNIIQRWNEITLLAAYQRPNGTGVATLFGQGQFASGFFLQQASGASGNISFSMYASNRPPSSGPITATAPFASATTPKVVGAKFDGTDMKVLLDGVAGSPVNASAYGNPALLSTTVLRGDTATGLSGGSSSTVALVSGSQTGLQTLKTLTYTMDNHGQFTGAGLAVFNKGLPDAQIQSWGTTFYN